jgi:hypothetical protein
MANPESLQLSYGILTELSGFARIGMAKVKVIVELMVGGKSPCLRSLPNAIANLTPRGIWGYGHSDGGGC